MNFVLPKSIIIYIFQAPRTITITTFKGRYTFVNGIYEKKNNLVHGRVFYEKNGLFIFWNYKLGQWNIFTEVTNSTCYAHLADDVVYPNLSTGQWVLSGGTESQNDEPLVQPNTVLFLYALINANFKMDSQK